MQLFDSIDQKLDHLKAAIITSVQVAIGEEAVKTELSRLMTQNPAKQAQYQAALSALQA